MAVGNLSFDIGNENAELYRILVSILRNKKSLDSTEKLDKAFSQFLKSLPAEPEVHNQILSGILNTSVIAVNDIGLGVTSIISLFLFKAFTNEEPNIEQITKDYGKEIGVITQGLANVHKIEEETISSQAENFRRLLLNMAKDVRVILIILSIQLENMRSMKIRTVKEQIRIASEASYLYAPLAHRLGLYLVKSEMEDLSLKYTNREIYDQIAKRLAETKKSRDAFIAKFIKPIEEQLNNLKFNFEIKGRPKSIHSIWNKMQRKEVGFEDIYDLFAIRIILKSELKNEKADCWQVYSAVTDIYQPNPLRMRDWISIPKTNGYESLHTTVIGPEGKWVEVQIRTERMNEIAEKGVAAHWKYKGLEGEKGLEDWLTKIREILETPEPDASDFIDDFKLSLYSKEIFVFTPKGDLRKFPEKASVLDFAYDVHTEVGATCTGAKVNGKIVPIRHVLNNGDKVEILTSKNQKPKLDWLGFVVTSRAQKKIRQALNDEKVRDAEHGKEIIKRRFKNWKIDYNDEVIRELLKKYKLPNAQEFYCLVSNEKIDLSEIKDFIARKDDVAAEQILPEDFETKPETRKEKQDNFLIIDEQVANVDYRLAQCCNPIMGDKIFGFVTINEGIKIHRMNCPNAAQLIGKYGYRVVNAKWTRTGQDSVFPVNISIAGEDQSGILNNITEVITKDSGVSLRKISIDTNEGAIKGIIGISVKDIGHLDFIINKLASIKGIYSVSRLDTQK